jgi:hypothetical protein
MTKWDKPVLEKREGKYLELCSESADRPTCRQTLDLQSLALLRERSRKEMESAVANYELGHTF